MCNSSFVLLACGGVCYIALTNVYLGDNADERVAYSNMFISPVLAPSHLLSQFPATHIVAGMHTNAQPILIVPPICVFSY